MDYADGGDLAKRINKAKAARTNIPEETCLNWLTQICLGLKHIHDRKVIHRDIKAQNVFLMGDDTIRLGDFGVARVLDYTVAKAQTQVGTPYYIAPEILKGRAYTNKADIWSLGVLFFEMCALDVPIKAPNLHELYKRIMNFRSVPALPRQYSASVRELVSSMLTVDASKRPSVADLLSHAAIKTRVSQLLSAEEQAAEFAHTVLHNENILLQKTPSEESKARPYSARSNRPAREEEAKARAPRPPCEAVPESRGAVGRMGGAAGRPALEGFAAKRSADKLGAKKPIGRLDQNKPPAQTPRLGMGARKNSEGLLHAHKLMPGLGARNSPKDKPNFHFNLDRPNPSQTPRNNGAAKKLGAAAPVGFAKQRPSSAAYGVYKAPSKYQKAKPLGNNNGRLY